VWFLDGNPVVGYDKKASVRLLFWSGQSFDEAGLHAEGSFCGNGVRVNFPSTISTGSKLWGGELHSAPISYFFANALNSGPARRRFSRR
jgi:hypothetical protein